MASIFLNNKTPKTVVEELVKKRNLTRTWTCVELQKTPPLFKCTCRIQPDTTASSSLPQQYTAEGHGSSKKDAEHCAAFKIIPKLVNAQELIQLTSAWEQIISDEVKLIKTNATANDNLGSISSISDTDDDEVIGEPIGQLGTICARSGLKPPDYKDQTSFDPALKKPIFAVTCSVDSICSQQARRWKKQDAKKLAAFRVIRELKSKGYNTDTSNRKVCVSLKLPEEEVTSSKGEETPPVISRSSIKVEAPVSSTSPSPVVDHSPPATSSQVMKKLKKDAEQTNTETVNLCMSSKLKRKTPEEDGEHTNIVLSSSSTLSKRKFELLQGRKLFCLNQTENCLRFVKDYAHVFQHLPPNSCLDEALVPRDFAFLLQEHGGPVKLLEKCTTELNATLRFVPSCSSLKTSSENKKLVLLSITFKDVNVFESIFQKRHVFAGVGKDIQTCKEDAALNGLKFLRSMMFSDDDSSVNSS